MANIRFLFDNRYSRSATVLVASSAASGLPVGASQNADRSYVWRSATGTGEQTIDIDLGAVVAVTGGAVANVRLLGAGVLELYERGDAGAAGAATLVATFPAADADRRVAFVFFASQSHRHWQLKWTNPTAANDYAELGYAFLGTYTEPTVNVTVPADIQEIDPAVGSLSLDGQASFANRTRYSRGAWTFTDAPEALLTSLREIHRTNGIRIPLFIVLDTALAWTAWYARLAGPIGNRLGELAGRYTLTAPWEEVR